MTWKKQLSYKYHILHPHHIYQLGVIFLFVTGFFLLFPYYLFVEEYHLDMTVWQWYFIIPWMILYLLYCLRLRGKIKPSERIDPHKKHIAYWMLLGIAVIMIHLQPINLERIYAIDFAFTVFSIFVADSYWDFKKLKLFNRS